MTLANTWISAAAAAEALGVSRATLYAYVSRGYVRSQAMPGASRERGYSRDDVERLRRRGEARRDPDRTAARALNWGLPILESSITLIDGAKLYYRGHDAVSLARERSLQEVASLLWTGEFDQGFSISRPARSAERRSRRDDVPFVPRAQAALAFAGAKDPLAFDIRPESTARCGWRILQLLAAIVTRSASSGHSIDRVLAGAWRVEDRGIDVLRAALILCADHELNVSAFTARSVASAGSTPYGVVIAGLAALEGPRHGGASARVESMLTSIGRARDLPEAITARLRRGELIEGFGHPLYPHGDPRAAALFEWLHDRYNRSAELAFIRDVAAAASSATHEDPNVDFALAALGRVLALPPGAPLTLFAIGRTIGWIAHAIEQYATGQLIRPRAKYVGAVPGEKGVQS